VTLFSLTLGPFANVNPTSTSSPVASSTRKNWQCRVSLTGNDHLIISHMAASLSLPSVAPYNRFRNENTSSSLLVVLVPRTRPDLTLVPTFLFPCLLRPSRRLRHPSPVPLQSRFHKKKKKDYRLRFERMPSHNPYLPSQTWLRLPKFLVFDELIGEETLRLPTRDGWNRRKETLDPRVPYANIPCIPSSKRYHGRRRPFGTLDKMAT
jgi:hypothetical protein